MRTLFRLIGCLVTVGIIFLIATNFSKPSKYLRTENMSEGAREFVSALDILSEDAKNLKDHVITSYSSIHEKISEIEEKSQEESQEVKKESGKKKDKNNSDKKSGKHNKEKNKKKAENSLD